MAFLSPLLLSCIAGVLAGGTGQAALGVSIGSTQTELQRFFTILGLGQGDLAAHSCSRRAMLEAA